jgi:hypothetical protein
VCFLATFSEVFCICGGSPRNPYFAPRKVQAIREVSVPENSTDLKSFLGLVNYYRKFIPDMATSVNHVNRSLSQDIPWSWSDDCQKSFETLKAALENSPLLTHYDSKKQEACYLMYCI